MWLDDSYSDPSMTRKCLSFDGIDSFDGNPFKVRFVISELNRSFMFYCQQMTHISLVMVLRWVKKGKKRIYMHIYDCVCMEM